MRILPLVLHARRRIPALTDLFSDALAVSSISVVAGGTTTITTSTAHGVAVSGVMSITITDAETPNPITAATLNADGTVTLTTQFDHYLTTAPTGSYADPWDAIVKLSGFGSASMDGSKQLVRVDDRSSFTVQPTAELESIALDGGEVILERLERELIGHHLVTATGATTLTMTTPASVARSYTITTPTVYTGMRINGVCDAPTAYRQYVRQDDTPTPVNKPHMWIAPIEARMSRSNYKTDAVSNLGSGTDNRDLVIDGFSVLVALPAEGSAGGATQADLAHGEIYSAVLKTFRGLRVPRGETSIDDSYVANLTRHGIEAYDRANYWHSYSFELPYAIVPEDAIQPYDWPALDPDDLTPSQPPIGAPPLLDIDTGLRIKPGALVEPGELTVNVQLQDDD